MHRIIRPATHVNTHSTHYHHIPRLFNIYIITSPRPTPIQIRTMTTSKPTPHQLETLRSYTACDIADALLKLKVSNAGSLSDLNVIVERAPASGTELGDFDSNIIIAPASTVLFAPKTGDVSGYPAANVPSGKHYVDLTESETIVVMKQPEGQKCAVLGGIMALRMKVLNAKGVVVSGRVRDVEELKSTGLPVSPSASVVAP